MFQWGGHIDALCFKKKIGSLQIDKGTDKKKCHNAGTHYHEKMMVRTHAGEGTTHGQEGRTVKYIIQSDLT